MQSWQQSMHRADDLAVLHTRQAYIARGDAAEVCAFTAGFWLHCCAL